jgi:hypothetical protein
MKASEDLLYETSPPPKSILSKCSVEINGKRIIHLSHVIK